MTSYSISFQPAIPFSIRNLADPAHPEPAARDLAQLRLVLRDSAAGPPQRIAGRTITGYPISAAKRNRGLRGMDHLARDAGLVYRLHGLLEALAVLGHFDGFGARSQHPDMPLLQKALLREGHGQVQPRLPAQVGSTESGFSISMICFREATFSGSI